MCYVNSVYTYEDSATKGERRNFFVRKEEESSSKEERRRKRADRSERIDRGRKRE